MEIGSLITEMTWKSSTKENDFGGCLNDNRLFWPNSGYISFANKRPSGAWHGYPGSFRKGRSANCVTCFVFRIDVERCVLLVNVRRGAHVGPARLDGSVPEPFRHGVQIPSGFIQVRPIGGTELVAADLLVRAGRFRIFPDETLY